MRDYAQLNPGWADLIAPQVVVQSYAWSSCRVYLGEPERRPTWLRVDRLQGLFAGRREARLRGDGGEEYQPAGWTSEVRHEAAYEELLDEYKFVLVTLTTGDAGPRGIIFVVERSVAERMRK